MHDAPALDVALLMSCINANANLIGPARSVFDAKPPLVTVCFAAFEPRTSWLTVSATELAVCSTWIPCGTRIQDRNMSSLQSVARNLPTAGIRS